MPRPMVRVEGLEVYHETDKAFLVGEAGLSRQDDGHVWLPKSQIEETDMKGVGDTGYVVIPEWLADDKDLDGEEV